MSPTTIHCDTKVQHKNSHRIKNIKYYILVSPGHAIVLQLSALLLAPTQSTPPPRGAGFVQTRVRVREPTPQVLEQLLQDDH